ncbi:hypothetical protein AgCh_016448 [Apium graveolens]
MTPTITVDIGMKQATDWQEALKRKANLNNHKPTGRSWINMRIAGEITVMEAEARGVQEAISWLDKLRLGTVIIECDSELVVKAVNGQVEYYLEVGHTIDFCKMKLRSRPEELIQQMTNVQYTENMTEEQLDAILGQSTEI